MKSNTAWFLAMLAVAAGVVAWATGERDALSSPEIALVELATNRLALAFTPPGAQPGVVEVEVCELEGRMIAKASKRHDGRPFRLNVTADIDPSKPADYYLRYRFNSRSTFRQKSLFFLGQVLETIVLGQKEYLAGTTPAIRVVVRDRAAGRPVEGAAVRATLSAEGIDPVEVEVKTDRQGEAPLSLRLPARPLEDARLRIEVATATARDVVEETVRVSSATRTMLTTDKPMYQPGQTIHMRALSLARPAMAPLRDAEVVFEVEDAKGNKVFKRAVRTDGFGVSYADFVLADELNQGEYRIRHIVGGAKEEKTVRVERYVLPKFKVDFASDRRFYQPGETVKGEVQADYFFGKPVAGGQVMITCSKFDVAYEDFQTVEGTTDGNGHYSFEVQLPDAFVGQPLEAGKASARFDIAVIDTADHQEKVTRHVTVTANPIIVAAVAESGDLVPGLENRIYVVTTYADATPAKCRVTWANAPGGAPRTIHTDNGGFGEFTVTPAEGQALKMELRAQDVQGSAGSATVELRVKETPGDDRVLLRTERTLYRVGETINLTILSTRRTGTVYVDLIKDRQTYLTKTFDLRDGTARGALTLDPNLAGTIEVSGYVIGANGVIVRDRRLLIVDPANDLSVAITSSEPEYLPGGDASITFRVTNRKGQGTAAALGVMVVDEAVFALQEMQPGLEKVYFYLERELATPRYEIHGLELEEVVAPAPGVRAEPRREEAARVLLASAKGSGDYTLDVNTYERDDKGFAFQNRMQEVLGDRYRKIFKALNELCEKRKKLMRGDLDAPVKMEQLIAGGYLRRNEALDPWGAQMKIEGEPCRSCHVYHGYTLRSAGVDGLWDTADDIRFDGGLIGHRAGRRPGIWRGLGLTKARGGGEFAEREFAADMAAPMAGEAVLFALSAPDESGVSDGLYGEAAPAAPRVREYFPETLYFNPAVITDGDGNALLNIPMADSITTWRLTCMASSSKGELGSATSGIRVFQDFFVDVDFPVALTQNDEVSVPVAVYNYLETEQDVKLVAEKGDWFEFKGAAEQVVTLGPSEVKAVYFPIVVKGIGFRKFTVFAYGAAKSDAVARSVEVVPDGKENVVTFSGRLEGNVVHQVTIPAEAIPGASKIFVKVYPGVLSQVVEGLDNMLRMPFGCFEQTSSVTYPNVLVLDYMKTTGQVTPELQMKAEGFINAGYQRLVSYEVPGGGFEWFGNKPAHRILTAYGLMEFHDMSKVFTVDPAIISRTQAWLAKGQEKDGSFKPSEGGIAEGAINAYRDDVLRSTAYIVWALAYSGYTGPEVGRGVEYIKGRLSKVTDNFTMAMVANALVAVDAKDEATLRALKMLFDRRTEEDDLIYWKAQSETPTHGRGPSADIEVTGLAAQAFVRAGRELGTIGKAVTYLVKNKDAYGTWHSTQATIQALRAMLLAESGATAVTKAKIALSMNGKAVGTLTVDESNSDVLQLVDLKGRTQAGENTVELAFEGEGGLMYQVVGRYYLPYEEEAPPHREAPMSITVDYDRTRLAADDILNVTATATWNLPGRAKMMILDLGLPPGFTLIPDELNRLVEAKAIQKYSVTGRQIIVYLDELASGKPVSISYQLLARYPLKAKTSKAVVYEYYNPQSRSEAAPVELEVSGKGE